MSRILDMIKDLRDPGVSGEYDENPITRAELADALEAILEVL